MSRFGKRNKTEEQKVGEIVEQLTIDPEIVDEENAENEEENVINEQPKVEEKPSVEISEMKASSLQDFLF